jgi:hypothetical protein
MARLARLRIALEWGQFDEKSETLVFDAKRRPVMLSDKKTLLSCSTMARAL